MKKHSVFFDGAGRRGFKLQRFCADKMYITIDGETITLTPIMG